MALGYGVGLDRATLRWQASLIGPAGGPLPEGETMPNTRDEAITSATHTGRYDCGHLLRSDDRALKRAVCIWLDRQAGLTVDTTGEGNDTLAALALMVAHRPCSEVRNYRTAGVRTATLPTTPATVTTPRVSPQVIAVITLMRQGYDIPEIAEMTYRSRETVRSLFGMARKATGAHSTMAAGTALRLAGLVD